MLTDLKVKRAEPRARDYKLYDQRGLYVLVTPKGTRSWRFKYRFAGKYCSVVLGRYPDLSLRDARDMVDELRTVLRDGKDPSRHLRRGRLVNTSNGETFEPIARAWHELEEPHWRPVHANDVLRSLERDVFPDLGTFPLHEIDRPLLLAVLQKVSSRGAVETAHRIRQRCEAIFNYAISRGLHNDNPAVGLNGAMTKKPIAKLWPAFTKVDDLRQLLHDTDTAGASPITRAASRVLALTAQRPGMIRRMRWEQIVGVDWDESSAKSPDALWIRVRGGVD